MSSNRMKVSDILQAQSLNVDGWERSNIVHKIGESFGVYDLNPVPDDYDYAPYRIEIKGRRHYDHRRGAILFVMYRFDEVISIGSFAGRELNDVEILYIYNREAVWGLISRFAPRNLPDNSVFDANSNVDVAYWEGCPIQLGEDVYGYD